MDRNGYNDSILSDKERCFICWRQDIKLDRHEIFHGSLYRKRSKEYGLWVLLCCECHRKLHNTKPEWDKTLKRKGQRAAMSYYHMDVEDFRKAFGKNYLNEEE